MVVVIFHMHMWLMYKYFKVKTKNAKDEYVSFYCQLDMFSWMKFFYTCCQHLGPQILSLVNIINQPNGQKWNHFPCSLFKMHYVAFKILYHILFNQMHYMNISKQGCMHYLFMSENWSQFHYLIHSFNSMKIKIVVKTRNQII
jgi:hypothetical protein